MPTLEHNGLVEMFRDNPSLAPHLLSLLFGLDVPPHVSVRVADSALDQLIPVEFRADLVLELRDACGAPVLSVVLEAQREVKARKRYAWPVYVTAARAARECATIVVVVAPDAEVAGWAAEKIDLGLGLGSVQPLVIGPATVPVVTDEATAKKEVELAVLSALAHGNGPNGIAVVLAALAGLARLDREHAAVYFHIIYGALREPMRRALEALVMERQTQGETQLPPFFQRLIDQAAEKAAQKIAQKIVQEAVQEAAQESLRDGRLEALRATLVRLAARRGIALGEADRARIQGCDDPAILERWVDNVLGAKTASDVLT